MKKEYIITIRVNDFNRNFGEITDQIQRLLIERDGVECVSIRSKDEQ